MSDDIATPTAPTHADAAAAPPIQLQLDTGEADKLRTRAEAAEQRITELQDAAAQVGTEQQLAALTDRAARAEADLHTANERVTAQQAQLLQSAALQRLPGLRDPQIIWAGAIKANVALDDTGALTPESVAYLSQLRDEKPHLFDSPSPGGTTAVGGAITRQQRGYSPEDAQMFRESRTEPGAYAQRDNFRLYKGLFSHLTDRVN